MTIMPRVKRLPALLLLLSACSSGGEPGPEGWKRVGNPDAFTFHLPGDFAEQSAREYRNATTTLTVDFGQDTDPLTSPAPAGAERSVDSVIVEQYPARIVRTSLPARQRWEVAIHVWGFGQDENTGLTMSLVSSVPLSSSFTNRIFSTIHFAAR